MDTHPYYIESKALTKCMIWTGKKPPVPKTETHMNGKSFLRRNAEPLCLFALYSMIWLNVKLGGNEQLQIILSSCIASMEN